MRETIIYSTDAGTHQVEVMAEMTKLSRPSLMDVRRQFTSSLDDPVQEKTWVIVADDR